MGTETLDIEDSFCKKPVRSWSGVLVITIVMKPDKFSCPYNCHYCPNETIANGATTDQPRSYLSTEPAVMRANQNDFDCVRQVWDRLNCLHHNGHTIDKLEIIVLGGTFSSYPKDYQYAFMRDIYYAANEFRQRPQGRYGDSVYNQRHKRHRAETDKTDEIDEINGFSRQRGSLEEEQTINEITKYRIIGISLETRPDQITIYEILRFRKYGCTRVQLGVQHTDNEILEYVNRGHTVERSIEAIAMLKRYGFKVDIHVMPDLPGSNPEKDKIMLEKVITSPDFSPDYMKIYPCLDVTFTEIRKWKESGKWKPYAESAYNDLVDVIVHAKRVSKPWIRFNRIQRDFPPENDTRVGYTSATIKPNLREYIIKSCKENGVVCQCIRCKEIKNGKMKSKTPIYNLDTYEASGGIEHFISATNDDKTQLYGFVRLRINSSSRTLRRVAMIRELHVYGKIVSVKHKNNNSNEVQHKGIGKQLLRHAEALALCNDCTYVSVISGVGVRQYYKKFGYQFINDELKYMTKELQFSLFNFIDMRYNLQFNIFIVDIVLIAIALICCFSLFTLRFHFLF